MTDWLIFGFAALAIVVLLSALILVLLTDQREKQSGAREASYREKRREFIAACRAIEQLPFYPWVNHFPRLEPFAGGDTQVREIANQAARVRQEFTALPARFSQGNISAADFWARLVDVSGNLVRLRRWQEDEKTIRAVERLTGQLKQAQAGIEQCFAGELDLRQSVIDDLVRLRQTIAEAENRHRALDTDRLEQVSALIGHARTALDCAERTLQSAALSLTATGPDDSPLFSQAYLCAQLAGAYLRHIDLLEAIHNQSERVNEVALLGQFDNLYQLCLQLAARPIEPAWETLQLTGDTLAAQQRRLEAIERELQKQVDQSSAYCDSLNRFLDEIIFEIQRAESAENSLLPYLGRIEDVPQAWEQVSGMAGRVSDQLKLLRHDLDGLKQSADAQRASTQNWARFHADKDRFLQLKPCALALQNKLAELFQEQRRLQARYEEGGSTAQLLNQLQNAADDCPNDERARLETAIANLRALRPQLDPHPGFNYRLLTERLDKREAEGQEALRAYQAHLDRLREQVTAARANFETLRARYLQVKIRFPRIEKDWNSVEQWVNQLNGFDASRAGFRAIDHYLKLYQSGCDSSDLEIAVVEQKYRDFDERSSELVRKASSCRDLLTYQANLLETSPWSLIFAYAVQPLREQAAAYGQMIEQAQSACAQARMVDAVQVLDQVTQGIDRLTEQANKLIAGYKDNFNDLEDKLRYYETMRAKYIASHTYNNSGTVTLSTADSYRDLAQRALDYPTARQALLDAQKFLGQF